MCRWCKKSSSEVVFKTTQSRYCEKIECQNGRNKNQKQGNKDSNNRRQEKYGPVTFEYESLGRKCGKCGKDPKPNYFYCQDCHHDVTIDAGETGTIVDWSCLS